MPVLGLAAFILPLNASGGEGTVACLLATLLVIVFTALTYGFVEAPCHRYAKRLSTAAVPAATNGCPLEART
jgi:peptidoglycan/LPS O-acetylase OafA/YrhL